LQSIIENELLQKGLFSKFVPLVKVIIHQILDKSKSDSNKSSTSLEKIAILTFCKFMCISKSFCEENLDDLFKLLHSPVDEVNKGNMIICIGDLFNRFPNLMTTKTAEVFALLRDGHAHVRKNSLMVISHLILNDMLRCSGEIVDVVMLLDDPSPQVRDLVRLFLQEYNSKGQQNIYNKVTVAITRLSTEFASLARPRFENIARSLLQHIDREKQTDNLVEQLAKKVRDSHEEVELRNTAYCLSQLKYSERSFLRLMQLSDCFRLKLKFPFVRLPLQALALAFKTNNKPRFKGDFKDKFEEFDRLLAQDENQLKKNPDIQQDKQENNQPNKQEPRKNTNGKKRNRRQMEDDDDDY